METVYTYSEWEKIYQKRKRAKAKRIERLKRRVLQRISGLTLVSFGLVTPFTINNDNVMSIPVVILALLVALPLGMHLVGTKRHIF